MTDDHHAQFLSGGSGSQLPERVAIALFLLMLLVVVGENTLDSFSAYNFHEEWRILYHLDPSRTNGKDYAGQFLGQFPQPVLYLYLTKAAVGAGVDLIIFHKLLGVLCSILLLAGGVVSGWRVGGALAAVATAVFIAAQPIYQYQLSSATPHAFAFPLLIWALACLLYDRPYWLAGLTVLSGLLYPPVSPVLGLVLAWHIAVTRKGLSGRNPDRVANVLVIAITAAISLAFLLHQLAPIEGYGATLRPGTMLDIYPENGPDGRHFSGVFHPLGFVLDNAIGQFHEALPVLLIIAVPICIVAVAGLGFYYSRKHAELFQPLLSFIVPSAMFCAFITLLAPYVAYRFLLYPMFTILPVLFVFGLLTLCYDHRSTLRYPAAVIVAVMAPLVIALSGPSAYSAFSPLKLDQRSGELMSYLQQLPADSLIAAWPGGAQTSLIPYVAGRPLFVNYKAHYPTYEGHIANMRMRMFDLIDAYLAQDPQPLIDLRCRWQVDFLVADGTHFPREGVSLDYFAPFDARIKKVLSTADKPAMILRQPPADAVVFEAGRFKVLDLAILAGGASCPDRA
ncbi:MAG: hypothetical protein IH913_13635 [Proteobacteria bacterium]|nr:hypothetical protein [Pseudomonadota bacterium]